MAEADTTTKIVFPNQFFLMLGVVSGSSATMPMLLRRIGKNYWLTMLLSIDRSTIFFSLIQP